MSFCALYSSLIPTQKTFTYSKPDNVITIKRCKICLKHVIEVFLSLLLILNTFQIFSCSVFIVNFEQANNSKKFLSILQYLGKHCDKGRQCYEINYWALDHMQFFYYIKCCTFRINKSNRGMKRSSHLRCSIKKGVFKKFRKIHGKTPASESLFE